MSLPIKKLEYQEIEDILESIDKRSVFEKINVIPDASDLLKDLEAYVDYEHISDKSVLGLDIYRYSSYGEFEQSLIPFVFKLLFRASIRLCLCNHPFIFQHYNGQQIEKRFISTGDGGFLILDTPLHTLLFASSFETVLRTYNSYHIYPKLRKILGGVSIRYAITFDKVYFFDQNHYGRAIINNARILSKDSLNRCLIDQNAYEWFIINTDGMENLQLLTIDDITNIHDFQGNYDLEIAAIQGDKVFTRKKSREQGIINLDILKIGNIRSKETELDIYNIHLQVSMRLHSLDDRLKTKTITISLGNLNTSGI